MDELQKSSNPGFMKVFKNKILKIILGSKRGIDRRIETIT
jgi:hypothetical protein